MNTGPLNSNQEETRDKIWKETVEVTEEHLEKVV